MCCGVGKRCGKEVCVCVCLEWREMWGGGMLWCVSVFGGGRNVVGGVCGVLWCCGVVVMVCGRGMVVQRSRV